MILNQRAFVFCPEIKIHPVKDPNKLIMVPVWENNGTTQTKNMFCHVSWQPFPLTGIPNDFTYPDRGQKQLFPVLIGPKSRIVGARSIIEEEALNQIIEGHARCYIWGWAEYNDVFDNKIRHRTEFCHEVVLTRIDGGCLQEFRTYGPHNGADDQCMKKPTT